MEYPLKKRQKILSEATTKQFFLQCDKQTNFSEWKRRLDEFRKEIGPIQSDSAEDIRELRDSR